MSKYDTLNEQQKKAVMTTEGPILCLAGAGSGKTRMLTHRVAYLMEEAGVNPYNIMAITFTNKAAGEMKERVEKLVGLGSDSIWITTFHSSCVRILRRFADCIGYDNSFTIYDSDDSKSVMKDICKRMAIDTKMLKERTILGAISSAKDRLCGPDEFYLESRGDFRKEKIAACYQEYQKILRKNNAMDFDDLIINTVELLRSNKEVLETYQRRFKYIMVDEYQDTNTAQFQLIRLLADANRNLCVVGDDDQSIYKFRGANIRNILDFEDYYPEATVIRLEQNYRSTGNVLDAANAVIRNNTGRKDKSLWTEKESGNPIHLRQFDTAYEEADYIASDIAKKIRHGVITDGDCAVLYRTNAQSRLLEEKFVLEGIAYNVVGGVNFYSRKEIKDILAYLKTIDNGADDLSVQRIINVPKRGIGAASISKVRDFAEAHEISFYDAMCRADEVPGLGKAAEKMHAFTGLIRVLRAKLDIYGIKDILEQLLEETQYIQQIDGADEVEIESRIENIDEFRSKVVAFEEEHEDATLRDFLAEVSLVADIDNIVEGENRILLMTLHGAKGLEFSHVYIAGMEDGLFPGYSAISADNDDEMEEERRLAYVGITRAKDDLTLCYAKMRMIRGEMQMNAVSRFIREIPEKLMDNRVPKGRRMSDFEENRPLSFENGRTKPYVPITRKRTAAERLPFVAKSGLDALKSSGIQKGVGASSEKPTYDVGDRVKHIKFGEGYVTQMEPGPRDYKVTIDFDEYGQKVMYAAFAKLQKI